MSNRNSFKQNKFLLKLLVKRNLTKMYRRSFLGYLWSVLNPLGIMIVMAFVFSNLFKVTIENFAAYLISAQLIFDFIASSTSESIFSVVGNASLLKKTYVPKNIFTVATVTSKLINMLFSFVALLIVIIFTGVSITPYFLLFPIVLIQAYFFALGLGMILSCAAVFFRDLQYMYSVFITAWMYASAVFYPVESLTGTIEVIVTKLNPMYFYIYQFRCFTVYGKLPEPFYIIAGIGCAVIAFILGKTFFKKNENKFFLYI